MCHCIASVKLRQPINLISSDVVIPLIVIECINLEFECVHVNLRLHSEHYCAGFKLIFFKQFNNILVVFLISIIDQYPSTYLICIRKRVE